LEGQRRSIRGGYYNTMTGGIESLKVVEVEEKGHLML
jgi:hypothetical protein